MTDNQNQSLSTPSVSVATAKELIRYYWQKDVPAYLWGPPGVAKSSAYKQVATEAKVGFIDIRLGTKLPEDLTGIPVPNLEKHIAEWLRAEFWPDAKRDGERGIMLFDEMSDTTRSIQSCAYQVILDRRLGMMELPKGWWPCAAGNRRQDKAAAQTLSTALANRFAHVDVMCTAEEWFEWGVENGIDPMVLGFIKQFPTKLHTMEGADLRAFATPRSWEMASKFCTAPASLRPRLIAGCVGEGPALEFNNFFKTVDLPSFEDIVRAPTTCPIPNSPASKYALSSMISRYLNRDNFDKALKYMMRSEFGREFGICAVLSATKRDASLIETKAYTTWALANRDIRL